MRYACASVSPFLGLFVLERNYKASYFLSLLSLSLVLLAVPSLPPPLSRGLCAERALSLSFFLVVVLLFNSLFISARIVKLALVLVLLIFSSSFCSWSSPFSFFPLTVVLADGLVACAEEELYHLCT